MLQYLINGIFSHSESVVRLARDFERGRTTYSNLLKAIQDEREELFKFQEGANFYTDGLLNWHDLLRPFEEILTNCQSGTLMRYFQTNSFFRILHFGDRPKIIEDKMNEFFQIFFNLDTRKDNRLYVLPSPSLFLRFSENISQADVNEILITTAEYIDSRNNGLLIFAEPFLDGEPIPNNEMISKFFETVRKRVKSYVFVHTYFGNIVPRLKFYLSLPVNGIGVDFYHTPFDELARAGWDREKTLVAEVVDTENSFTEDETKILDFIEKLCSRLKPANIYVSGNADFYFLPYEVALKKANILKNISLRLK